MHPITLLFFITLLANLAPIASATESGSESFRIWGGGGYASNATSRERFGGAKLIAGLRFPSLSHERQSVRASASRVFDGSDANRYSLLVHVGYRVFDPLEIAFMGGVGYLESRITGGTYLKPVIGAELLALLMTTGRSTVSGFAAYEVFRGSTGTLALDGGPDALTTRTISVGLVLSFELFRDSGITQVEAP